MSAQNLRTSYSALPLVATIRGKKDDSTTFSQLITPVQIKPNTDDINVGAELTGSLDKQELLKIVNKFSQKNEIRILCMENGLDSKFNVYFF